MSNARFNEIMKRRDRISRLRFVLPEDYTFGDALVELHEAYEAKSNEKMQLAFDHLAFSLCDLDKVVKDIDAFPYPEIRRYLRNLQAWYIQFDNKKQKYLDDLILEANQALLNMDLSEHIIEMQKYCDQLQKITQLTWTFDGIELVSEPIHDWNESDPKLPKKTTNKILEILISRKILSGRYDDAVGWSRYSDDRWHCQVLDQEKLFSMDRTCLVAQIKEASTLISAITEKPCQILNLYSVESGRAYEYLETLYLATVKEYYAFYVNIVDFNLDNLHLFYNEIISNKQLIPNEFSYLNFQKSMKDQFFKPKVCEDKMDSDFVIIEENNSDAEDNEWVKLPHALSLNQNK